MAEVENSTSAFLYNTTIKGNTIFKRFKRTLTVFPISYKGLCYPMLKLLENEKREQS